MHRTVFCNSCIGFLVIISFGYAPKFVVDGIKEAVHDKIQHASMVMRS